VTKVAARGPAHYVFSSDRSGRSRRKRPQKNFLIPPHNGITFARIAHNYSHMAQIKGDERLPNDVH
jgi:hypothetical protein